MKRNLILVLLFSIAMGFMESAIVIYLRELYYPNGFTFPLTVIPPEIGIVEILREASTLIMLLTIGAIVGRNLFERLCFFLFSFAIWDIFYYIFLKIFLDWPESIFTWDILFLIPVPWIGPVIAPCILSLTMIALTMVMYYADKNNTTIKIRRSEWLLFISGAIIVIISFVWDYVKLVLNANSTESITKSQILFDEFANYIPAEFTWGVFITGEILILISIAMIGRRIKKHI